MRNRHIQRMQQRAQLIGLDGMPITSMAKGILFTQWLPGGKSIGRSIDRGPEVNAHADRFIARGGRFSYVIRAGGIAELVAGFPVKRGQRGEMTVVAQMTVPDGPSVPLAVDRLVAMSIANMDAVIQGESQRALLQ